MYKLVIIDIDGTLITEGRRIRKQTRKILKRVTEQGVYIALSTGRNKRMTNKILSKLNHKFIHACVGGAEIYDENHNYIYEANLSTSEVGDILNIIGHKDCCFQLTLNNGYHKFIASDKAKVYDIYGNNSIKHRIVNKYIGITSVEKIEDFYQDKYDHVNELIVAGEKKDLNEIKLLIENKFENIQARDDMWENYLFIGKRNNNKSNAMTKICAYYGVEVSEVIAIGNDCNDIDMIKDAGLGIAMGNSIEELKAVADDITYTNQQNGVAKALEHYIIEGNDDKINYKG